MEENDDDTSFLHSIPLGTLLAFRNSVYNAGFIASNPERFVDTSTWVDIPALRKFVSTHVKIEPETSIPADIHVKQEYEPDLPIKREREPSPQLAPTSSIFQQSNNTRVYVEDAHEVTEIFDSDEEQGHFPGASRQGPTLHDEEIVPISWHDDASSDTVLNDTDDWHHSNWHDTDSNASIESLREGNSSDYDAIDTAHASTLPVQLDPDSVTTQPLSTGPNSEMLIDANSAFSVNLNDATSSRSDSFLTHWPGELHDVDMITSTFKSNAYAIECGMHLMRADVIPATTQPHDSLDSFVTPSFDSLTASSASSDTFDTFQMDAQPCIDSEVFANTGLDGPPCLVTSAGHIPDSTLEAFEIGHNPLGLSSANTAHDDFWATADIEFLANYGRKEEGIP